MVRSAATLGVLLLAAAGWSQSTGPAPPPAAPPQTSPGRPGEEFFERHVRPLLAEHCLGCHGPGKQRGGLRLDSVAALRQGSDSGPVVVPGHPERSLLTRVIRHDGPTRMPPRGKLPDRAVEALTAWVRMGAPWPEAAGAERETGKGQPADRGKDHWAFQPVRKPALPPVKDSGWVRSPVDAFILARLEANGLEPGKPADRRTLIRRATFDLHGLPPTPEEVEAFEADTSPD